MKSKKSRAAFTLLGFCCCCTAYGEEATPLSSVLALLQNLVAQVQRDGEQENQAYHKFSEWCDNAAGGGHYAVDGATKQKAKLEAEVEKLSSDIELASTKIEELASSTAEVEAESNSAKAVREKENADFREGEKELMDMIDALGRAANLLEKKGAAALAQVDTTNMNNVVQALRTMLEATSFPTSDRSKLLALVQAKEGDEDGAEADAELGAPQAAAYQSQSGNIIEVLEDMKEDAETQLTKLRQTESESKSNYDVLMLSLKDRLGEDSKEMAAQKGARSKAAEAKATAEGDLQMTTKDLKSSGAELQTVQSTCMQTASDHDATVASRKEELTTLEKAIEIVQETANGATSFVQVAAKVAARSSRSQVLTLVKRLAKKHRSAALAQLASRIATAIRSGAADPFAKVKGLIKDMIRKLDGEALAEAREKQYCDRETSRTSSKQESLEDDFASMTATIDSAASSSAQLREQVKQLQSELSAIAKEQAEMDQIRAKQHAKYETEKSDLEQAIHGVRQALGVLRDYYGGGGGSAAMLQEDSDFDAFMQQPAAPEKHSKAQGAGSSLIEILALIESDFAENLAKVETQESDEATDYAKVTAMNKVTKASKEEDVKFMTARIKALETTMTENAEDRETSASELSAVETYLARLKDRCVAKPDTFEERKKRREAEIKGLKEALTVLNDEAAAFLQRSRKRRSLRAHRALDAAANR